MLTHPILDKFDPSGMYKIYDRWPELARKSYETKYETIDFKDIDHVVFCGMGGSGSICDVFSSILSKSKIHVNVTKGYVLPETVDSNTLVITVSVSGNTKETLSVLDLAKKRKSKIIAFSSGGQIENYCKKNNILFRKTPFIHSPRSSFASILYSMLNILEPIIPMKKKDIYDSLDQLEKLGESINSSKLTSENPAYTLSMWIKGIPLIYYPYGLQAAAIRFKNSLQENAKSHVIVEDIIEASHNGIVAWERKSNVQPIIIRGQDDHPKTKERWEILKEFFDSKEIDYQEIISANGNILSKLVSLVYLLDYTSIYLAILNKLDPTPIDSLDYVKSKLKES